MVLTADEVHNQNTPGDGPLLQRGDTATLGGRRNLGNVYRYLSRADTDAEAVDDTADDQHGNVDGGTAEDRANDPRMAQELAGERWNG